MQTIRENVRLNESIRNFIRNGAINYRFRAAFLAHLNVGKALAAEVRIATFSAEEMAYIEKAPDGFLKETDTAISLQIGHERHALNFSGLPYYNSNYDGFLYSWTWVVARENHKDAFMRMPDKFKYVILKSESDLAQRIRAFHKASEAFKEDFKNARTAINAILKSCNSVKTLKAAWPEVEPFLPKTEEQIRTPVSNTLPAISIPTLNALFKLPVPKEKEEVA